MSSTHQASAAPGRFRPAVSITAAAALAAALATTWMAGTAVAADRTIVVRPGQSIQAAVDRAHPGDRVLVRPGVYRQVVTVRTDGLTLSGFGATLQAPATPPPGLDCIGGRGAATFGICLAGRLDAHGVVVDPIEGVTVTGFVVRGFAESGVVVFDGTGNTFTHLSSNDNGGYGILSEHASDTLMAHNRTRGNAEAGYYVGVSPVAAARVVDNTSANDGQLGVFIRNANHGVVARNSVTGSCVGIGLVDVPATAATPPVTDWVVAGNVVAANTAVCPDDPTLSGTGILLAGVRDTTVRSNVVVGNRAPSGTASSLAGGVVFVPAGTFGNRPSARVAVTGNVVRGNAPFDLLRLPGSGTALTFAGNVCGTSRPAGLC